MCQRLYEDDWCDMNQHFIPRSFVLSLLPGLWLPAKRYVGTLPCDQAKQAGRFGACDDGVELVLNKRTVEACTGCRIRRAVGITVRKTLKGERTFEIRKGRELIDEFHPLTGERMTEEMAKGWARIETKCRGRMEEQGLDPENWKGHFFGPKLEDLPERKLNIPLPHERDPREFYPGHWKKPRETAYD